MQPRRPLPPPQLKQEKVRPSRPLPPLPQPQQLKQETVRVATSAAASSVQQANFRAYPSSIAPADALSSTAADAKTKKEGGGADKSGDKTGEKKPAAKDAASKMAEAAKEAKKKKA